MKKGMLHLALEKKDKTTRGVAVSDGLGFSGDGKIIIFANISPFMFVYPQHFHKSK